MGLTRYNAKKREKKEKQVRITKKKKGSEVQRAKPSTSTRAVDELKGFVEQNGEEKKEKRNREQAHNPVNYLGPCDQLL